MLNYVKQSRSQSGRFNGLSLLSSRFGTTPMSPKTDPAPPYTSPPRTRRHLEYYHQEGDLVIQISDTLFKLWSVTFRRHSEVFCKEYGIAPGKSVVGYDDEHPVVIFGVSVEDFERLLWIMYPPVFGKHKATTTEHWISILDLSTLWKFKDIRTLAMKELGALPMHPIDKVVVQQKYDVDKQWVYASYSQLCSRADPLSIDEARRLGVETTARIAIAREKLEKWGRGKPTEVKKVVCEVFAVRDV